MKNNLLIIYLKIFFFLIFSNPVNAEISIVIKVDDHIITNYDLDREINYLKILNPNLEKLDKKQIHKFAKKSLITEKIKEKEINKFINIYQMNKFVDKYTQDLISRLNLNEADFKKLLKDKNTYNFYELKNKINIELFWNELIISKYSNIVKIDERKLNNQIESFSAKKNYEYLLSEIVFNRNKDRSFENFLKEIQLSISEVGFENTASIYSISDTSKIGGKLGWISEKTLSKVISKKLDSMSEGEYSDPIQIGNNYIILKIEKIRSKNLEINKEDELKKLIEVETNRQLNQFSKIYFAKIKMNYSIDEK